MTDMSSILQEREEIQRKAEQERLAKQRENARLKMERERRVSRKSSVLYVFQTQYNVVSIRELREGLKVLVWVHFFVSCLRNHSLLYCLTDFNRLLYAFPTMWGRHTKDG